jgi:hypothetical protein
MNMKLKIIIIVLLLLSSIAFGDFVKNDIKPWDSNTYDLGSSDLRWNDLWITDIYTKSPKFDVRAYGATGDGSTNDYDAINDALTAATNGGTVLLPVGHYIIETKLTIPDGVKLEGAGHHIASSDNNTKIEYTGSGFAIRTGDATIIEDMTIESADDGIEFYGSHAVIKNCFIVGANASGSIGIQFSDGTLTNPSTYDNLLFCRVRKFKQLLLFKRYANTNYVFGGQLINTAADSNMVNAIYMDSANKNYINIGIEGECEVDANAIELSGASANTCFGNKIGGYVEITIPTGAGKKLSWADEYVNANEFYFAQSQLSYDDVFSNVKAAKNRLNYVGASPSSPDEFFYQSSTENILANSNLNYALDADTTIMPFGWARTGSDSWNLSDESTTLYGQRVLKATIDANEPFVMDYDVPDGLTTLIAGRPVTFGCWLKTSNSDAIKIHIRDVTSGTVGLSHANHSGGGAWEYQQISMMLNSSATSDDIYFRLIANAQTGEGEWNFEFAIPTVNIGRSIRETRPRAIIDDDSIIYRPMVHNTVTLADSAIPSVKNGTVFLTGGTTTITNFADGVEGQVIHILAGHTVQITDGTNILLNGSTNITMVDGDSLLLVQKADGKWYEIPGRNAGFDHGALDGLGDDDHTYYLLADGTRDLAGDLDPDTGSTYYLGANRSFLSIATDTLVTPTVSSNSEVAIAPTGSGEKIRFYLSTSVPAIGTPVASGQNLIVGSDGGDVTISGVVLAGNNITMPGQLLTLSNNSSGSDVVIDVLSSGNDGKITYDQSADEFELEDAAVTSSGLGTFGSLVVDTSVLAVDAVNNRVGIGTASPSYTFHMTDSTTDTSRRFAFYDLYFNPASGSGTADGYIARLFKGAGDAVNSWYANVAGAQFILNDNSTMTQAVGFNSTISNLNGRTGTITTAINFQSKAMDAEDGTITNAVGFDVQDNISDNGSVVNNYGIRIADMDEGTTKNYAIHSSGGASVHAGNVRIGSTTDPTNALDVTGASTFGDGGTTDYAGVSSTGDISFAGSAGFYPRFVEQATEPANGTGATQIDDTELLIWRDTDDDSIYLVFNDNDNATKKIVKVQLQ